MDFCSATNAVFLFESWDKGVPPKESQRMAELLCRAANIPGTGVPIHIDDDPARLELAFSVSYDT
jgi:hypothetical protein